MTIFFRLTNYPVDSKEVALAELIAATSGAGSSQQTTIDRFERSMTDFSVVPRMPFAYWVSNQVLAIFERVPPFESGNRVARRTNGTTDDKRWIRLWWEASSGDTLWVPHAKGGAYSQFYADLHLVIAWDPIRQSYPGYLGTVHRPDVRPASLQYFFRPGLTWSRRSQKGFSIRALPRASIFGDKGPGCFDRDDSDAQLLATLAVANSQLFGYLVGLQMSFGSYEAGVIQSTPVPRMSHDETERLAELARQAWSLERALRTTEETSHSFVLPDALSHIAKINKAQFERALAERKTEINEYVLDLYRLDDASRSEIFDSPSRQSGYLEELDLNDSDEEEDEIGDDNETSSRSEDYGLISWLVGVSFGRFDARLATGERPIPSEPEPFDPLPVRSPGMWPADEEPPIPLPPLLVDDPGHADDLALRVSSAAASVQVREPDNLRRLLAREFFPVHIKMYSKSRRKAPIYWQLATPSASYSVWLYTQAFTKDTLFLVQNDYVVPKLRLEERRLETMRQDVDVRSTAAGRRALAGQEAFVDELRSFLDELKRVTPLWDPDPDDGVIINFAPLWRLVSHHRPWQKELKTIWDALCVGKYDWSHLAMHLWPDRVVPKCATDRSLAIAHDLENVLWEQGADGKWSARPTRPVGDLVQERTSPAVRDALQRLLNAPTPASGGNQRGRGGAGQGDSGGL